MWISGGLSAKLACSKSNLFADHDGYNCITPVQWVMGWGNSENADPPMTVILVYLLLFSSTRMNGIKSVFYGSKEEKIPSLK